MSKPPQSSRLVSKVYNAAYKIGFSPWDLGPPMPELVDIVEGENRLTPGRAVDLGCGAGSKSVYLAQHGWDVTGVDIAPEAIKRARKKAEEAGLDIEFVVADLVDPAPGALTGPFDFLLDFGCAHSLRDEAKARYAEHVAAIAAPGATLFLFAFTKGPLSVRREEVDSGFAPYWDLVSATPGVIRRTDKWDAGPTWYRMTRRA
ncbi:class I SAM-dependent methyltransferase [Actinokineospora soli]|uniref:Class I SAM-dependent methyltransferase n=1 Tax=Actinokineospora soli TaxID=1048753 RepID=A0ABW2TP70_9PSEU